MNSGVPTLANLLSKFEQVGSGCWEWVNPTHKQGYGTIRWDGRTVFAHRLMVAAVYGVTLEQIREDVVRHSCDNTSCVNPLHLLVGTQQQNCFDRLIRGRRVERLNNTRRLSVDIVTEMRRRARQGERGVALAHEFGISKSSTYQAIRGYTWSWIEEPPVTTLRGNRHEQ
jgi:hypothetical protein